MSTNDASVALNALNKISEEHFQQLQAIQTQFYWSCVFIYGDDLLHETKSVPENITDPRHIYVTNPKDESYLEFANKNNVKQQFIYYHNKKLNCGDYCLICDEIAKKCDFPNHNVNDKGLVAAYVGGLQFFGKYNLSKKYLGEVHKQNNNDISETFESIATLINEQIQLLEMNFKISMNDFKENNGYVISPTTSFCSNELKEMYLSTKSEYENEVNKVYDLIKSVPSLQICYNNASLNNVNSTNDSINYVNIKQVVNCAGEVVSDSILNSDSDEQMLKLIDKIEQRPTKTEIIQLTDEKIQLKIDELKKRNLIRTIIIIILLIIFVVIAYFYYNKQFELFAKKFDGIIVK